MAEGVPVITGESVNIYQEHEDPLALAVAVGSQEPNEVDWKAVLERVGVMRGEDGKPMEGANVLGATALQMISSASMTEALTTVGGEVSQHVREATTRLERSGIEVADDLGLRAQKIEVAGESAFVAANKLDAASQELSSAAGRLEGVASDLGSTLHPTRIDQLSEAGRDIARGSQGRW